MLHVNCRFIFTPPVCGRVHSYHPSNTYCQGSGLFGCVPMSLSSVKKVADQNKSGLF